MIIIFTYIHKIFNTNYGLQVRRGGIYYVSLCVREKQMADNCFRGDH